jgi:acetate kinase
MSILVLNCGSSSVKYSLYSAAGGVILRDADQGVRDYPLSLHRAFARVEEALPRGLAGIRAVGHRVVHGGGRFTAPQEVDEAMLEELAELSHLAPLHNPRNISGIEHAMRALPHALQVAVFDTAFHAGMPERARTYALPGELREHHGIRRYGFHGISYTGVHRRLFEILGCRSPRGLAAILCHLGNGCSAAAVKDGVCVDTTMGFTPLEGLVMGTRCGDLDPGALLYLLDRSRRRGPHMSPARVFRLLNSESGLLGLSGLSADVRDLTREAGKGHAGAALALEVFAYRLKKAIAACHGVLGGADALVFTGGIGENAASLREAALAGMEGLGFALDRRRNRAAVGGAEGEITGEGGSVRIFIIPSDEDRTIHRQTAHMLRRSSLRRRGARRTRR